MAPEPTERPKHKLADPLPRFGTSFVSLVIWISFGASLVALVAGVLTSSPTAFLAMAGCAAVAGVLHYIAFSRSRPMVAVRRVAVRLPVLRDPEVQRLGALAGIAATTCARCESFNLEIGQHQISQHGDFRKAAAFLRPAQMQKTKGGAWSEDNGFDKRGQPVDEGGPSWTTLGGCTKKGIMVFGPHSCEEWS